MAMPITNTYGLGLNPDVRREAPSPAESCKTRALGERGFHRHPNMGKR